MNKTSPTKRCAIYCRKSHDHYVPELQRAHCERYIKGEHPDDWTVIEKHYDDDLIDGAVPRQARQALLEDIKAGKVDVVVVQKIGHLFSNLQECADILTVIEAHHVSLVAVEPSIDTSSSYGRMLLNVLITFAQIERENMNE